MVRVLFHLVAALILIAGSVTAYSDASCKMAYSAVGGISHGKQFTDIDSCESSRDVIGIGIRSDKRIDGCGFYWTTSTNTTDDKYHGGQKGRWELHPVDPSKEYIISVKIYWDKHDGQTSIFGLCFTTSLNNKIMGGTLKGKEKLYEAPVGFKMCGISGSSDNMLDSVGPVWVRIHGCGAPETTPPSDYKYEEKDEDKEDNSCSEDSLHEDSTDKDSHDPSNEHTRGDDPFENKRKPYMTPPSGAFGPPPSSPAGGPYGPGFGGAFGPPPSSPAGGPYGPGFGGVYVPPPSFPAGGYNPAAAQPLAYRPNSGQSYVRRIDQAYGPAPATTAGGYSTAAVPDATYRSGYVRAYQGV